MDQQPTQQPEAGGAPSRMAMILKEYVLPAVAAALSVRLFGLVGGLVAFVAFLLLRPRLGTLGAVLSGVAAGAIAWFVAASLLLR